MVFKINRNVQRDQQTNDQQTQEQHSDLGLSDLCIGNSSDLANDQTLHKKPTADPISVDSDNFNDFFSDDEAFEQALTQVPFWIDQSFTSIHSKTSQVSTDNTHTLASYNNTDSPEVAAQGSTHDTYAPRVHNDSDLPEDPTDDTHTPTDDFDDDDLPEIPKESLVVDRYTASAHDIDDGDFPEIVINQVASEDEGSLDTNMPLMNSPDGLFLPRTSSPISIRSSTSSNLSLTPSTSESTVSVSASSSASTSAVSTSSFSASGSSSSVPAKRLVLRKRSEIQINPFTIESAQFNKILGRLPSKSKLSNTQIFVPDDYDTDPDFTLTETQQVDEHLDEALTQELSSLHIRKPKKNSRSAKTSSVTTSPATTPPADTSPATASPVVENDNLELDSVRQKYGLDKLILPPTNSIENRMKKKPVTFQIKKKGSKKKQVSKSRLSSRTIEDPPKDIFDFDLYAKASAGPSAATPIVIDDSTSSNSPLSHMDLDQDDLNDDYMNMNDGGVDEEDDLHEKDMNNNDSDDDSDDIPFLKRPRLNKRSILSGSSEDEDDTIDEVEENRTPDLTQEQLNAIFDFPTSSRRHLRNAADTLDNIVPIVHDEAEYRENKKQRIGIKDLRANALKNVLPASYYKLNKTKFNEEIRQRQLEKQTKSVPKPSSTATYHQSRVPRNTQDIFAAFRSQSDESDDGYDNDDHDDQYDYDDNELFFNPPSRQINEVNESDTNSQTRYGFLNSDPASNTNKTLPTSARTLNSWNESPSTSVSSIPRNTAYERLNPASTDSRYPEAMEDNRVPGQRKRANDGHNHTSSNTRRPTTKPSKTEKRRRPNFAVKTHLTTSKRRKRLKKARDDIYVLPPHFSSNNNQWKQRTYKNETIYDTNDASMFKENVRQRAVDDIGMYTKPSNSWRKSGLIYIGNYDISDYIQKYKALKQTQQYLRVQVYSLHNVVQKVYTLADISLWRMTSLKETTYLHHKLLYPLLSSTPERKSAYIQFEKTHSELVLFGKKCLWRDIRPNNISLIDGFFARVFQDIAHMRFNDEFNRQRNFDKELPGHDHFYIFVSLCITQWIPNHEHDAQMKLAEQFAIRIQSLAWMLSELTYLPEAQRSAKMPWKVIVKLMLFILDWTCRLHLLGFTKSIWSVTDCTQILLDLLVHIGYEPVKAGKEDYAIEPWICIFRIMSVSIGRRGYHFNEQVFLNQMTSSIKRKSKTLEYDDVEKRRTTAEWSETLDNILVNYMMEQ